MTDVELAPLTPAATNSELLLAAVSGRQQGWQLLVDRFEPQVIATVRMFRLQPSDAHDAAQATWLRLLERSQTVREPEALGGWLRTVARRECLRIIREGRGGAQPVDIDALELPDEQCDLQQAVVDSDEARRLYSLVDRLPTRSATLVRALFGEAPPSYSELSERCDLPIGSIGPTRARAVRTLRRWFDSGQYPDSVSYPAVTA